MTFYFCQNHSKMSNKILQPSPVSASSFVKNSPRLLYNWIENQLFMNVTPAISVRSLNFLHLQYYITIFHFIFSGQKSACDVLLRRGGQISSTNLKENPPLHLANRHGHWSVADSLLKEGADPEQPDGSGIQNNTWNIGIESKIKVICVRPHKKMSRFRLHEHSLGAPQKIKFKVKSWLIPQSKGAFIHSYYTCNRQS